MKTLKILAVLFAGIILGISAVALFNIGNGYHSPYDDDEICSVDGDTVRDVRIHTIDPPSSAHNDTCKALEHAPVKRGKSVQATLKKRSTKSPGAEKNTEENGLETCAPGHNINEMSIVEKEGKRNDEL